MRKANSCKSSNHQPVILIIGGTGFIGKNLSVVLHKLGYKLRIVSRTPDMAFIETHVLGADAVTLDQFLYDPRPTLLGVVSVVYLASISTPGSNFETPWHEARGTVEATMRVMLAVAQHSEASFVYLSSGGAIYGETTLDKIPETQELRPISPYGLGKKMTEAAVEFIARTEGVCTTILRPSNPIGCWGKGVVNVLIHAARDGNVFMMNGDGSSATDYFDVRDLAQVIKIVIDHPNACNGKIWNVGSSNATSLNEILEIVQNISGTEIEIKHLSRKSSEVTRLVLDTQAIGNALGWKPHYGLRASIEQIWKNF